jgi:hypothetical protein
MRLCPSRHPSIKPDKLAMTDAEGDMVLELRKVGELA